MTLDDWIKEKQKLCDGAKRGPWEKVSYHTITSPDGHRYVCRRDVMLGFTQPDMKFIADARSTLPICLEIIRKQKEVLGFYGGFCEETTDNEGRTVIECGPVGDDGGRRAREALSRAREILDEK